MRPLSLMVPARAGLLGGVAGLSIIACSTSRPAGRSESPAERSPEGAIPAPRGHAFRKAIYRKVGVVNSADQAAAVRTIRGWSWVDSTRIGVWGWSGGGTMTLNLMFRYPEIYRTGMAVASMAELRLYDTIYQERYMGLPQENEAAYHDGSPLFFADRLRGNLLVVHGSGDDNVHFQGTERLINALVAANRPFTLMMYTNRTHCICEGDGTGLHLYSLLTRYLEQNLPAGGR